jgi:hypothetical protein
VLTRVLCIDSCVSTLSSTTFVPRPTNSAQERGSWDLAALLGWGGVEEEALEFGWVCGVHRLSQKAGGVSGGDREGSGGGGREEAIGGESLAIRLEGGVWETVQADVQCRDQWTSDLVETAIRIAMPPSAPSCSPSGFHHTCSPCSILGPARAVRLPGKVLTRNGAWVGGGGGGAWWVMVSSLVVLVAATALQGWVSGVAPGVRVMEGWVSGGGSGVGAGMGVGVGVMDRVVMDRVGSAWGAAGVAGVAAGLKGRKVEGGEIGGEMERLEEECRGLMGQRGKKRGWGSGGLDGCLLTAAAVGQTDLVLQLLDRGGRGLWERGAGEQTVMHAAAASGNKKLIKELISRGTAECCVLASGIG